MAKIILYKDADYKGESLSLTYDCFHLSTFNFDNKCSSIMVMDGPWFIYDEDNFGGNCAFLIPGNYSYVSKIKTLNKGFFANDKLASVRRMPLEKGLMLFESKNFGGRMLFLKAKDENPEADLLSIQNLKAIDFNDQISSYYCTGGTWKIFKDSDFKGESQSIGEGMSANALNWERSFDDNSISSILQID